MSDEPISAAARLSVTRSDSSLQRVDSVVGEEPLEIRINDGQSERRLGITMRTPGADLELAVGFLWSEGLLRNRDDLRSVTTCKDLSLSPRARENVVVAHVAPDSPAATAVGRTFTVTSACGVCGADHLEDLRARVPQQLARPGLNLEQLAALPEQMRTGQKLFDRTGGTHAAALFAPDGQLVALREDVGRHNALDKVIGFAISQDLLPLSGYAIAVSGRGGFELVHKAIAAQASALVSVSATTTLAVETARAFGLTLLAFARAGKASRYSP